MFADRFKPFHKEKHEIHPPHPEWLEKLARRREPANASEMFRVAFRRIEFMERDLAAIRSRVERAESGNLLSDEVLPYLKLLDKK